MHVGSKINYEDDKAREGAEKFRVFLSSKLHEDTEVMGLDMFAGHNVDIIADLCSENLFDDDLSKYKGHFKSVICWALLEHVVNPFVVARNISEFLAPGGVLYYSGPWVWGYHPYPADYWRISFQALKALFPNFGWAKWWYAGTNSNIGFTIGDLRNERKVFQLNSETTRDFDTLSDRYLPYLSINAIGVKSNR